MHLFFALRGVAKNSTCAGLTVNNVWRAIFFCEFFCSLRGSAQGLVYIVKFFISDFLRIGHSLVPREIKAG